MAVRMKKVDEPDLQQAILPHPEIEWLRAQMMPIPGGKLWVQLEYYDVRSETWQPLRWIGNDHKQYKDQFEGLVACAADMERYLKVRAKENQDRLDRLDPLKGPKILAKERKQVEAMYRRKQQAKKRRLEKELAALKNELEGD